VVRERIDRFRRHGSPCRDHSRGSDWPRDAWCWCRRLSI